MLVVLLPTVTGQLLRIKIKDAIASYRKTFSVFSQIIILLIILNAVASSAERIKQMGFGIVSVILFAVLLHGVILAINLAISKLVRLDRASTATFTIHNSQKTLTISFIVWSGYFSGFAMGMIPIIAYHLVQLIVDTVVAERFRNASIRDR